MSEHRKSTKPEDRQSYYDGGEIDWDRKRTRRITKRNLNVKGGHMHEVLACPELSKSTMGLFKASGKLWVPDQT
jgi:hypothetical protein